MHAEPLLDGDEVTVVVAEEGAKEIRLVKLQLEPRPIGDRSKVAACHQAASF
jgi:hypothetical protein